MKIGNSTQISQNINTQLDKSKAEEKKALERIAAERALSGEDTANLLIADDLRNSISSYSQGVKNANEAVAMLQIADGALQSLSDSGVRLTELAVAMNNGALNSDQKAMLESEAAALQSSMSDALNNATYNGRNVFAGDLQFATSSDGVVQASLTAPEVSAVDISDQSSIASLMESVSRSRSNIGSTINELESLTTSHLQAITNLTEGESKLQNSDVAENYNVLNAALLRENASLYANSFNADYLRQNVAELLA